MSDRVSAADYQAMASGRKVRTPGANKYGAKRIESDGYAFRSKHEAQRYHELKLEWRAKRITGLRLQVPFAIVVNDVLCCTYVADFVYERDGVRVVEDVKGHRTQLYILKKRLMQAVLGIDVKEI